MLRGGREGTVPPLLEIRRLRSSVWYPWAIPYAEQLPEKYEVRGRVDQPCEMIPTAHAINDNFGFDNYREDLTNFLVPSEAFLRDGSIEWDGVGGYRSRDGSLAFNYSPAAETGPGALLVNQDYATTFLEENGYVIIWTVLAEKMCIGGSGDADRAGRSHLSRIHAVTNGKVISSTGVIGHSPPVKQAKRN